MNKDKLKQSIEEAERFLIRAHECVAISPEYYGNLVNHKLTAAVKRASMDLSRSLTELRKVSHD